MCMHTIFMCVCVCVLHPREVGWDALRVMGTDELFLQMLEAATR